MTLDNPDKKKPKVDKELDVSGAYRAEEDEQNKPKRPAFEIAEEAAKKGRFKKSLHQPYNSKATPETKHITNRILGEKDED